MGLIMLDLDGTLVADALVEVETPTGTKLQRRQSELYTEPALLPNRYEVLQAAAAEGDSFAIVTNQGGVAWGYHTQAECLRRITNTVGRLSAFWGQPFSVHVAYMHPKATVPQFKGDDGRKPAPAMLADALEVHQPGGNLDPHEGLPAAIMVGDRDEDREAAEAAGVEYAHPSEFFGP